MKIKIKRDDEFVEEDTVTIEIGSKRYRISESDNGKLIVVKTVTGNNIIQFQHLNGNILIFS